MINHIDISRLSEELKAKRNGRGLREVATEITEKFGQVSASTLSRIEQGKIPDLETFVKICKWIGLTTEHFLTNQRPEKIDSAKMIEAHLRADRSLDPKTITAISEMIRLAYNEAKNRKVKK
jgi:transcriptional regulator with XRE-family HTH domain